MIFSTITLGKEMALRGWLCTENGLGIELPKVSDVVDFCTCSFMCNYNEKVWVFPSDLTNTYKNDYRSVLVTLRDTTSSYTFKVIKADGTEINLIDNTYGELFDVGFNTTQPLKAGYRIDWVLIYNAFGAGNYQIEVTQTDFGTTVTALSHVFTVQVWNELASNMSVKVEFVQMGAILNGEDYRGMEWSNMVRINGKFGSLAPEYEINRLVDSNQRDIDIQTTKVNKYTLECALLPDFIGDMFTDNIVLTDSIFISVNDIFNYKQYRRLEVTFDGSIDAGDDYSTNNRKLFKVSLKDKATLQKRNFL
ncbi:MAG: hypothetical protein COA36_16940 [Desulfotalea sp.]|nr:MAG: hypothetical protein COA36_16940 [Desulfotalea sp.]